MTKRKDHVATLRKLRSTEADSLPLFKQLHDWVQSHEAHRHDDRETTLIAFTFLENCLKKLLTLHFGISNSEYAETLFVSDGDQNPVLGSAFSRGLMAQCLGLIGKRTFRDIKTINMIRNTFAHSSHQINYSNPSIVALSYLETMENIGVSHDVTLDSGSILFHLNMDNARSRLFSFIIYFSLYCGLDPASSSKSTLKVFFD